MTNVRSEKISGRATGPEHPSRRTDTRAQFSCHQLTFSFAVHSSANTISEIQLFITRRRMKLQICAEAHAAELKKLGNWVPWQSAVQRFVDCLASCFLEPSCHCRTISARMSGSTHESHMNASPPPNSSTSDTRDAIRQNTNDQTST